MKAYLGPEVANQPEHLDLVRNPDEWARCAGDMAELAGRTNVELYRIKATQCTVSAIRSRAHWMLVNGHWHRRV